MCFLFAVLALQGQSPQAGVEPVIRPRKVRHLSGQLANRAGHTIDLAEGMQLNFRMVGTQLRLYWLDADGLVVEPQSSAATIRFRKSIRGKKLFPLKPVSGDVALGHPASILSAYLQPRAQPEGC